MVNNLLPFDPMKAKNGDVVEHVEFGDMTYIGMYGEHAVCCSNTDCALYYVANLRLRPPMVKRYALITTRTTLYETKEDALKGARNGRGEISDSYITTIEIEVPEG